MREIALVWKYADLIHAEAKESCVQGSRLSRGVPIRPGGAGRSFEWRRQFRRGGRVALSGGA